MVQSESACCPNNVIHTMVTAKYLLNRFNYCTITLQYIDIIGIMLIISSKEASLIYDGISAVTAGEFILY
jgi:hypothetical protein